MAVDGRWLRRATAHSRAAPRSDNALNPDGAAIIAPLLSACLSLVDLRLHNTGIGPSGGQVCPVARPFLLPHASFPLPPSSAGNCAWPLLYGRTRARTQTIGEALYAAYENGVKSGTPYQVRACPPPEVWLTWAGH